MAMGGGVYAQLNQQDAAVGTGNGTVMDVIVPGSGSMSTWVVQIKGITSATFTFEVTVNGTDWVSLPMVNVASGASATTATADGVYRGSVIGLKQCRARISTWVSGTITATGIVTAY